jgi:hypothetical protein
MLFNSVATAALLLRCHSVSQVIVAILLWIGQPSCPNAVCGVNFHPKTMGPMSLGEGGNLNRDNHNLENCICSNAS